MQTLMLLQHEGFHLDDVKHIQEAKVLRKVHSFDYRTETNKLRSQAMELSHLCAGLLSR